MIIGVGVDIVDLSRIRSMVVRLGAERVYRKLLTEAEAAYCQRMVDPIVSVTARVAAKEAGFKALAGTMEARGIGWREIEIGHDDHRRPRLILHGRAAARARELGVTGFHVSMSHGDTSAVAVVVLEKA
ncbi:MAG: holo-ACP synthase [Gemmatimonadaceae bacterium]|nr:holo-ACP synthase [Gemmatimonadaceae bacterium]